MPTFSPPTSVDLPTTSPEAPALANRLFRFYAPRGPRGRSVLKNSDNTYTTYDSPTQDQIDAAKVVTWPDGSRAPAAYIGGHVYDVTSQEYADLTAAGYAPPELQDLGGYAEGYPGGF